MALNTSLSELVSMLKSEIGDSLVAGTQKDPTYKRLLATKQKLLVAEFDFPYLEDRWDVVVTAGSRYLTIPTANVLGVAYSIDFSRPIVVERLWNTRYEELIYGIGSREFNTFNSDLAEQSDPIQKWRWSQYSNLASPNPTISQRFEVWPLPTTEQTIRFTGQRLLSPLVVDSDRADIDDLLLVLSCAVEILLRSKQQDAQARLQNAIKRLQQIRAAYPEPEDRIAVFGGSRNFDWEWRRRLPIIAVASSAPPSTTPGVHFLTDSMGNFITDSDGNFIIANP